MVSPGLCGYDSSTSARDQGFDSSRLFIDFFNFMATQSLQDVVQLSASDEDLPGSDDVSGDRGVVGLPGFRPGQLDRAGCEPDDHRLTGRLRNIWNKKELIEDLAGILNCTSFEVFRGWNRTYLTEKSSYPLCLSAPPHTFAVLDCHLPVLDGFD